jgi:hypothetical protein
MRIVDIYTTKEPPQGLVDKIRIIGTERVLAFLLR